MPAEVGTGTVEVEPAEEELVEVVEGEVGEESAFC
jgi:hypothetical protein